jgi:hypothetical protein
LRHAFASIMIERGPTSSVLALELLQRLVRDRVLELVDGGPVA